MLHGNEIRCAGYPFAPDGSRDRRTGRGSGRNRRRCSRLGTRRESDRSPVLPDLACRGEQARVAPGEEVVCEVGLEGFGGYLMSVHVHRVEAYGVVLGVKRVFIVRAVVGVVVDAAQYETFRQGTEEQVLTRV